MRASDFVKQIRKQYAVEITAANGGVKVRDLKKLPQFLQITIAGHRQQLQRYLVNGIDDDLVDRHKAEALEALGCYRILVEEVFDEEGVTRKYSWTHDQGDDYLAQLLVGLLDHGEVAAARKQAEIDSKEAVWSKQHPPIGRIFGRL